MIGLLNPSVLLKDATKKDIDNAQSILRKY